MRRLFRRFVYGIADPQRFRRRRNNDGRSERSSGGEGEHEIFERHGDNATGWFDPAALRPMIESADRIGGPLPISCRVFTLGRVSLL